MHTHAAHSQVQTYTDYIYNRKQADWKAYVPIDMCAELIQPWINKMNSIYIIHVHVYVY